MRARVDSCLDGLSLEGAGRRGGPVASCLLQPRGHRPSLPCCWRRLHCCPPYAPLLPLIMRYGCALACSCCWTHRSHNGWEGSGMCAPMDSPRSPLRLFLPSSCGSSLSSRASPFTSPLCGYLACACVYRVYVSFGMRWVGGWVQARDCCLDPTPDYLGPCIWYDHLTPTLAKGQPFTMSPNVADCTQLPEFATLPADVQVRRCVLKCTCPCGGWCPCHPGVVSGRFACQ
jgi:hypothetical protein